MTGRETAQNWLRLTADPTPHGVSGRGLAGHTPRCGVWGRRGALLPPRDLRHFVDRVEPRTAEGGPADGPATLVLGIEALWALWERPGEAPGEIL